MKYLFNRYYNAGERPTKEILYQHPELVNITDKLLSRQICVVNKYFCFFNLLCWILLYRFIESKFNSVLTLIYPFISTPNKILIGVRWIPFISWSIIVVTVRPNLYPVQLLLVSHLHLQFSWQWILITMKHLLLTKR